MEIKDLGEKELIKRIQNLIPIPKSELLGNQDDVFLFKQNSSNFIVLNTDMLVGKTDVPPMMDYFQVGVKAAIMNVSDLIVKGIIPKSIIVSLGLPPNLKVENFEKIIKGIYFIAHKYDIDYIGGDINEACDLIIDITIMGELNNTLIPRSGIKPGDSIITTGKFGFTTAGLHLLLNHEKIEDEFKIFKNAVLEPTIKYKEILAIASQDGIIGSIDSSDGLAASLFDLMEENQVGFEINNLFIEPRLEKFSRRYKIPIEDLLFLGGEEYHAIFIINPDYWKEIKKFAEINGYYIQKIGKVIDQKKILYQNKKLGIKREITKRGFEHFIPYHP